MSAQQPSFCAGTRALIVEDVAALRTLLRLSLMRSGVLVEEAEGLQQARGLLRKGFHPNLVLLDLELGDGMGLDLVRELPPATAVHVLTADPTEEIRLHCMQAGCASIINKTQDLTKLVANLAVQRTDEPVLRKADPHCRLDRQYLEFLAEVRVKLRLADPLKATRTLRRIAHRLSGTAVHFGYPGLGFGAQTLRQALEDQNDRRVERSLAVLDQRIGEALEAFHYRQRSPLSEEV